MGIKTRTVPLTPRQPQHSESLSLGLSDGLDDSSLDDSSSDELSGLEDSEEDDSELDDDSDGLEELSELDDSEDDDSDRLEELADDELLSERLDESLQLLELLESSISQQLPSRTMAQQTPLFFCFQRICAEPSMHVCR